MNLSTPALNCALRFSAERAFPLIVKSVRLSSIGFFGLILNASVLLTASPVSAQSFTSAVWAPYTDRYGIIHSVPVDKKSRDPSTNNGLLYTAEACVMMRLQNVSYDRARIAAGVQGDQVKPGLFRRSPIDTNDTEAPDDYIGLGALAGVCGFHDVARNILNYGNGGDQASGSMVLGLNPVSVGKGWLALLRRGVKPGQIVPYNYNNVNPGTFTLGTWMGKFPAIIVHWKLAAGDRPTQSEFAIWSAALVYSGEENLKGTSQDPWLQSWLMVLTYEMSGYHSAVADAAVSQWWKLLHQRYPGGIKQTMSDYLAAGASGNPLSEYIDDFEGARNPSAIMVDSDGAAADLLGPLEGLFSMNCGLDVAGATCIADNDFSPTNFLAPFTTTLTAAEAAVDSTNEAIAAQQELLDLQATALTKAKDLSIGLNKNVVDFQGQIIGLQQKLTSLGAQKAEMVAKKLDKIQLLGHFEIPCKRVFGKCIPLMPPPGVFMPGKFQPNPTFVALVNSMTNLSNQVAEVQRQADQTQKELQIAQKSITSIESLEAELNTELDRLRNDLTKAKAILELSKGGLEYAQAIVQNVIPGVLLPTTP
ncbi:hypothetical protein [Granulicella sp. L60]|uniref:hypothetical protein n=1 Tax=Granulicella sp. L60 TaxID=1641866 RepID=UPI00131A71C8|nr:hypothetical protein [Granulicella sp. L60]